jgi:integrase
VGRASRGDRPEARDLRHYFATVLICGAANVKTVQLAMGHSTTSTVTLDAHVGPRPDATDQARALPGSALGGADVVPAGVA